MIDYKELSVFTSAAKLHVESMIATFNESVLKNGKDSFTPMCIYLDSGGDIKLGIVARDWKDKDDMYKVYAEMLYAFSALKAHCVVFANDVRITKYSPTEPHTKTVEAQDALNIAFVTNDSSATVNIPYTVGDGNIVKWHEELSVTSPLTNENPSEVYQGDMVELFYIMSHINTSPFTPAQLMNYYSFKGYSYQLSDSAIVEKVQIDVEQNENDN